MSRKNKISANSNWQKNWGNSIAVKATAPVFWLLIAIGLISATFIQNKFASELPDIISADADQLSYEISRYMMELEGGQPLNLEKIIEKSIDGKYFISGQVTVGLRIIDFG